MRTSEIVRETQWIDNDDGWQLALHRYAAPDRLNPDLPPVLMVPGYAMNAFILGFRPGGPSIAEYLAARGHQVFCADLRAQGAARPTRRPRAFGIADVALIDVPAAIRGVQRWSGAGEAPVDAVGCSLGATYVFACAAWSPDAQIGRIVNIGGPLRWTSTHPLLNLIGRAPIPWRALPLRGTRPMARRLLPKFTRVPGLLHVYLHPAICDLSSPADLTRTVDDPVPQINAEVARWIREADFTASGRNLTRDVASLRTPLLTVVANADGIVPEATTCSAHNVMRRSTRRTVVWAGTPDVPMAHADLFISRPAEAAVFAPIAEWLAGAEVARAGIDQRV